MTALPETTAASFTASQGDARDKLKSGVQLQWTVNSTAVDSFVVKRVIKGSTDAPETIYTGEDNYFFDETAVPAEARGLKTTPVQARQLVESFWKNSGFADMAVIGVYLTQNSDTGNGSDREAPDPYGDNSAYVVACGKSIDGILPPPPCPGDPHWSFESCTFTITDNGIETFNWGSPYAYGAYTTENSALLTFDKVDEIFRKMMLVKYDISGSGNGLTSATYRVDRVALEMSRVTDRKSSEKGLLVPVWNFYGSYYFTYEDGHAFGSDDREGFPSPLLRINAIDGTVIEPRYGC